ATVPVGASTGPISVDTPNGTAFSSTNFTLTAHYVVTGADAGGGPQVVVRDAATNIVIFNFDAYDSHFTGGVRVAVGDVNRDGIGDIGTGRGSGGGPDIEVFDGVTRRLIRHFFAYDSHFTGGVYIAAGDVNGDGFADIICGPDAGGGPNISVFSGRDGSR